MTTSRTADDEAVKTMEWRIPRSARPTFYRHREARCPSSRPFADHPDPVSLLYDAPREREDDKIACGDSSSADRGKGPFASNGCHVELPVELDVRNVEEEGIVTARDHHGPATVEDEAWTKPDTSAPPRKTADSMTTWRCRCELRPREEFALDLLGSSCDRRCQRHRHHHHRRRDCCHRHCYCQRRDDSSTSAKGLTRDFIYII